MDFSHQASAIKIMANRFHYSNTEIEYISVLLEPRYYTSPSQRGFISAEQKPRCNFLPQKGHRSAEAMPGSAMRICRMAHF